MISCYKYYFSANKELYIAVGRKYGVRPFLVYRLAHGKKAKNKKELEILWELRERNVIRGVNM